MPTLLKKTMSWSYSKETVFVSASDQGQTGEIREGEGERERERDKGREGGSERERVIDI